MTDQWPYWQLLPGGLAIGRKDCLREIPWELTLSPSKNVGLKFKPKSTMTVCYVLAVCCSVWGKLTRIDWGRNFHYHYASSSNHMTQMWLVQCLKCAFVYILDENFQHTYDFFSALLRRKANALTSLHMTCDHTDGHSKTAPIPRPEAQGSPGPTHRANHLPLRALFASHDGQGLQRSQLEMANQDSISRARAGTAPKASKLVKIGHVTSWLYQSYIYQVVTLVIAS